MYDAVQYSFLDLDSIGSGILVVEYRGGLDLTASLQEDLDAGPDLSRLSLPCLLGTSFGTVLDLPAHTGPEAELLVCT
jgi:hypothetical protein